MPSEVVNRHEIRPESGPPEVPSGLLAGVSATLFKWLGSFWTDVYEDDGLVKNLQGSRAERLSQRYLDLLEVASLVDRKGAPVFHRERWFPVIVRRSQRNKGPAGLVRLGGNEVVIGEQTSEIYPEGTVFPIGGDSANFSGIVVYPIDGGVKRVVSCIVDNIAAPTVVLRPGVDFTVLDGGIAVLERHDPFSSGSFAVFDDLYSTGPGDSEAVMWACDALFDKDYVGGHLGYAVGLPVKSTDGFKRIVNAVWDSVSEGAAPRVLLSLVASLCGVPTVRNREEVVEAVVDDGNGMQVVTDLEVYDLPKGAVLRKGVATGSRLRMFDTLDDTVRVYPFLTNPGNPGQTDAVAKDLLDLKLDIPVVDIPPAIIRSDVEDGFYVGWDERGIVCHGFDANGNPKLSFRLEGSEPDNDAFWGDVWARCEKANASVAGCFAGCITDTDYAVGRRCGSVSPIRFFLRQLIGANTLVVTVRTDAVPPSSPIYDPRFFATVRDCMPSHVRLYFIEHDSVESAGYDLGDMAGDGVGQQVYDEEFDEADLKSDYGFRARDRLVRAKFVARCRKDDDDED